MFIRIVGKSSVITLLLLSACVLAICALMKWPQAAAAGVSRGLSICGTIIIPSLFPFLVISGFLVKSGISEVIGRRLEWPVRKVFGLPGCCAAGILIGLIGGFPSGAIAVGELVDRGLITRAQGRRMLCFCVNAGPAFLISAVGAGMMGNIRYGIMLYLSHIAASLIIGILLGFGVSRNERAAPAGQTSKARLALSPSSAFVESVMGACRSLLAMCGFIILFAAVLSLLDGSGVIGFLSGLFGGHSPVSGWLIPGLLEVSCGSLEAASAGALAPFLLGITAGWGGLSVHCQIAATLHGKSLVGRSFFIARAFHSLLGGLFGLLLFRYTPIAAPVFKSLDVRTEVFAPYATSVAASVALLFACAIFLMSLPEKRK